MSESNDAAVLALLERGRARITPPGAWTQRAMARDKTGIPRAPTDAAAVCWCSIGALECVSEERPYRLSGIAALAWSELAEQAGEALSDWQDKAGRTHAETLYLWDRAIATVQRRIEEAGQ